MLVYDSEDVRPMKLFRRLKKAVEYTMVEFIAAKKGGKTQIYWRIENGANKNPTVVATQNFELHGIYPQFVRAKSTKKIMEFAKGADYFPAIERGK